MGLRLAPPKYAFLTLPHLGAGDLLGADASYERATEMVWHGRFQVRHVSPGLQIHDRQTDQRRDRRPNQPLVLVSSGVLSILNRSSALGGASDVAPLPLGALHNHLAYVPTFPIHRGNWTIGEMEPDPFDASRSFPSVGKLILFNVLNPTPKVRMVLDYTATLNADGDARIPKSRVIGKNDVEFQTVGRGSTRMISPPISPQVISGQSYVELYMGERTVEFREPRSAIMSLYGRDVRLDPRHITGFARNISLITESQYEALRPPAAVSRFPQDLYNQSLQYSGLYEDGWTSEHVFLAFRAGPHSRHLVVSGLFPAFQHNAGHVRMTVLVDRSVVATESLAPGTFDISSAATFRPEIIAWI